jgi:HlyD family secretion protein
VIPEGTLVEPGEVLVELDSTEHRDRLMEESIELENAEAELISATENLAVVQNQAEADIAKARLDFAFAQQDLQKYREGEFAMQQKQASAKITLARAELQQAEDRLEGSQRLFENRYISATELESDQLSRQRAAMDLELAEQEKELLETFTFARQIAQLESDVEQTELALERAERKARANVAQAEARLSARRAEVQRERTSVAYLERMIEAAVITAPTAGMVVYAPQGRPWDREVLREGIGVRQRQELIYLPTADAMAARIKVHESQLNKVTVGQRATVTVDALPGQVFYGTVDEIAVMPGNGRGGNADLKQYDTTILLDDTNPALRSGMTCNADILVEHFDEALTVPLQAVIRVDRQTSVFVARNGRAEPIPVELGLDNNRKVRVISGLEPGTRVLLNPPLQRGERQSEEDLPAEVRPATTTADRNEPSSGDAS